MGKKIIYILMVIVFLLFVSESLYILSYIQPKIVFTSGMKTISDEDYKRILNNQQVSYSNKNIDKFKEISVGIKSKEPMGINSHIKIERDILKEYLRNDEHIQILGGNSFDHGSEYNESIEVYLIDISEDELKKSLENFKYKAKWNNIWNNNYNQVFYLKDYLSE
ncbi:hypothetical protein NNC19_19290 [Clostridium sp. SHJSY1]|uniref:hypothetical protein n=1 Tax=Clostridium sp. SHJSY1 TaxID=2942483 RepID=UPI0028755779|nr:hypothetical protein [Clostridium sp. SHJSY1]MDS0527841.1 hypothetical protein [Clostridium sp. SHJSY1]